MRGTGNRSRIVALLVAPALLGAVVGVAGPAYADDTLPEEPVATAPPAEPEEVLTENVPANEDPAPTVPVDEDGLPIIITKPSGDTTNGSACSSGYRYYPTAKYSTYHKGVGATQSNYNGTSLTAKSTFRSEVSGSVGVAVSGELKTGASIAVASIETKYAVNLSVSLSVAIGNQIAVSTPPKTTTNAKYGVYRLKTAGYSQYTYTNCTKGVKYNSTLYSPNRIGWYIWAS